MRKPRENHGMSYHPLYRTWLGIMQRCYNPSCCIYPWYGAKGVTVCDEWKDNPVAFIKWGEANGWKPGLEIDKDIIVNGNKVYSPSTCKFVTHAENQRKVMSYASNKHSLKVKLSSEDVQEIINRKLKGEKTKNLSKEFNTCITNVNRIFRLYKLGQLNY